MADSEDGDGGGIDGRTIALGALALAGIVLVVRVLRGGGDTDDEEAGFEFGDEEDDSGADGAASDATDDLPVDAPEGVSDRFDEIDVVDAVYIIVAGLKAAREEYRKRTDEGGA